MSNPPTWGVGTPGVWGRPGVGGWGMKLTSALAAGADKGRGINMQAKL